MKVSFTAKEYARILELVHMGLCVAATGTKSLDAAPKRYSDVEQKLLGLAVPFGCAQLVETDEAGELAPSEKLASGEAEKALANFTEQVFWRELVERLAERDLLTELGPTKLGQDLTPEQNQRLDEIEDAYWREFETNGTDHVVLLKGGRG